VKISIIVPSYNQGCFLEDTIESIHTSSTLTVELLVMDGGSTDATLDIIKKYEGEIAYWQSQPDKGQADAINQGMRRATGDILCWLNSDDMFLPGTLRDVAERFQGRTGESLLLYGSVVCFLEGEKPQAWPETSERLDREKLTYTDYIRQAATFWTRPLWEAAGPLDISLHYAFDWEWFIRASKVGQFEYVPKFFALYRKHAEQKTGTGKGKRRAEIREVVRRYADDYWISLYEMVEHVYPAVRSRVRKLQRMPVSMRKKLWFLRFSHPRIAKHLKRFEDVVTVLDMYEG